MGILKMTIAEDRFERFLVKLILNQIQVLRLREGGNKEFLLINLKDQSLDTDTLLFISYKFVKGFLAITFLLLLITN